MHLEDSVDNEYDFEQAKKDDQKFTSSQNSEFIQNKSVNESAITQHEELSEIEGNQFSVIRIAF